MSLIPCLTWVRRGKAKSHPTRVQIEKDDLKRIIGETKDKLEELEEGEENDEENTENIENDVKPENDLPSEATAAIAKATNARKTVKKSGERDTCAETEDDDFDARYNMDEYDDEENDLSNPLRGIGNLTVHASNDEDPYVTLKDGQDDSDSEDFEIKPTDNLILVGRADEDFCTVEVHVYNQESSDLYIHHDIILPSFPLAVEWLDYDVTEEKPGNLVAIGTMEPIIDIWDLDLVDNLEPIATLGEKPKKKKKSSGLGHTDAVLDLSWNKNARHVLASASADNTVGLWDLQQGTMALSVKQHKDKVQCIQWHPVEEHMLLSGSFDKTVKMFDCRSPDTNHKTWDLGGEIEKVVWNHFSPLNFFASTDTGHIFYMDSRQDKPLYTMSAHNESVTGLCLSSENPSLLVTTSTDQTVKVWDISDNKPSVVLSKNMKLGQLHCLGSCPDAPYVFAFGGKKSMKVWDIMDSADVLSHFGSGGKQKHKPSLNQEDTGEVSVSMDTQESGIAMETDTVASGSSQQVGKNKKKKKKKPKKKNF